MAKLTPRPYQQEAIAAVRDAWGRGVVRPAVVMATGLGKTVVFAHLASGAVDAGQKVLVLVHRDELAKQAKKTIQSVAPDLRVGIVKAELNEVDAPVVVGSVQTLMRPNRRESLTGIGMIVADECHHAAAPSWSEVLEHYGAFDGTPTVGFTATMNRADSRGLGDVWQEVVFKRDILWGIMNGYLCDLRGESVTVDGLDLATVAKSRGDYQDGSLGEALEACGAGQIAAQAYREKAGNRQGFAAWPTVSCAHSTAEDFNAAGIPTEVIVGDTPYEERDRIFERYRKRETQVLSSVMALTEGWDMPQAEVALIGRPTTNPGLFTQIAGRVARTFPGKTEGLILDVVGATRNVSLSSIVDLSETKVQVKDSESLGEAYEREEFERGNIAKDVVKGKVTSAVAELFANSTAAWLQTYAGTWFIPAGDRLVLLWPSEDGTFKVGHCSSTSARDGEWVRDGLTLGYALAWGEALAIDFDPTVASRTAKWRKSRRKPSQQQVDFATRLKIDTEGLSKVELSDAISIKLASKMLDPRKRK